MCYISLLRLPNFFLHLWFYRGRCYCCWWQWCLFFKLVLLHVKMYWKHWKHSSSFAMIIFQLLFLLLPPSPPLSTKASLITSNLTCKLGHRTIYVYITKSWHDRIITFFCFAYVEKKSEACILHRMYLTLYYFFI